MPEMNVARLNAASCSTKDGTVYIFCGYNDVDDYLNSIEILTVKA